MTKSFDVGVFDQLSNEPAVTTRLMELINNLSESQQQALLTTLVELVEKTEACYLDFLEGIGVKFKTESQDLEAMIKSL